MQQSLKAGIRDVVASSLSLSGLTKFSRKSPSSITILSFHRVLPAELRAAYPLPGIVVTPDELHWILGILKDSFEVRTVSDACTAATQLNRKKPIIALSFDDGQWDNLRYAVPVLGKLNLRATFYIPTAYIGGEKLLWHDEAGFAWQQIGANRAGVLAEIGPTEIPTACYDSALNFLQYLKALTLSQREQFLANLLDRQPVFPAWARLLDWPEVREMQQMGHEIGSHSRTHSLLSQLSGGVQQQEINQSSTEIESAIGVKPESFCYPDGNFSQKTLSILERSHYKTAVTTRWGANQDASARFELCRFDMNSSCLRDRKGGLSIPRLQFRLSPYQPGVQ